MKEHIDRIKVLRQIEWYALIKQKNYNQPLLTLDEVVGTILDVPTADVVEVKHGEWIEYPSDAYMKCSVCGMEYLKSGMPRIVGYCPNPSCGAKMKVIKGD